MGIILVLLAFCILFLLTMLALIAATAASVMGGETPIRQYEPTCGGCGYIIKDLKEPTCEVCNAKFSIVGIVKPSARAPSVASAHWLAFRQVSGTPLAIWSGAIGLHALESSTHIQARPRNGGYESLIISTLHRRHARGRIQLESPASLIKEASLEIQTQKGPATLKADLL